MNVRPDLPTTRDAFERWVQRQEGKYEWDGRRGVVVMMTGISRNHARVTSNIARLLVAALPPEAWDITVEAFGVEAEDSLRYPDLMVERRVDGPGHRMRAAAPLLLVEVLSPSTAYLDMHEKQNEYLSIASLQTYLVFAQDEPRAWIWTRGADGAFPERPEEIDDPEGAVALPVLGLDLPFAEVYRAVF